MRSLIVLLILFISFEAAAFDNLFGNYEAELYSEVHPSNDTFYSTYYNNKMDYAFDKFKNDDETLLIDTKDLNSSNSLNIASPVIHPDSKVKNIFIRNEINSDIYVHNTNN